MFKKLPTLLLLIFSISVNATVYETVQNGKWSKSNTWSPSKPSLTWSNPNDTIFIKHDIDFDRNLSVHGQTIIIESSASLIGNKSITADNSSIITNNGTLDIKNFKLNWGNASFKNNGNTDLNQLINSEGRIVNNGTLAISGQFKNDWNSVFVNNSDFTSDDIVNNGDSIVNTGNINCGGDFKSHGSQSSVIISSGDLSITGYMKVAGDFNNSGNASISGDYTNIWSSSSLINSGSFSTGGDFRNDGDLVNNDSISVAGNIDNKYSSSSIDNSGIISAVGDFTNEGSITNSNTIDVDGSFENKYSNSTISNTGNILVNQDFTNKGEIDNYSLVDVEGNFENRWSNSDFNNQGSLEVLLDLDNDGIMINDGQMTVDGTVTTSGAITGSGDLCKSDGVTDPTTSKGTIDCNICGGDGGTLPVELVEFDVVSYDKFVLLNWSTASEENNKHFEIQISTNSKDFETVGIVNGNGNSTQLINYQFKDKSNKTNGIYYYRLKQVDFNGDFKYSPIKDVLIDEEIYTAKVYPNPVNKGDDITIEFNKEINAEIQIYTIEGRLINISDFRNNKYVINNSVIESGYYIIKIISDNQIITKKVHIIP